MPTQHTTTPSQPNLFAYATSELSQDAFICWLAAWADSQYEQADLKLYELARLFIVSMVHKVKTDFDTASIKTVHICRQVGKLDVLIEVNKELPDKLAILVEDKTHTSNHSDQLNRYYQQIKANGYTENQMIPLYFKTGYQSRFDTLGVFKPYLRSDFLAILRNGRKVGVQNAIFIDFLAHLEQIELVIQQFADKDLSQWNHHDWQGFFMILYDARQKLSETQADDGANWGYVANPAGGFWGYWWHFKESTDLSYLPYLQLEKECLTFKIKVDNTEIRRDSRDQAHQRVMDAASRQGLGISRPDRMGNGQYMTVARMKDDYRVSVAGKLDLDATLANMKKAQDIVDMAFGFERDV